MQFAIRKTLCTWGGPLVTVLGVGQKCNNDTSNEEELVDNNKSVAEEVTHNDDNDFTIVKKDGFLFDCVDLCIEEGSRNCILGPTASGKTTLLKVLAKIIRRPTEGTVHHAPGLRVAYYDTDIVDSIVTKTPRSTALDYLIEDYPLKTEEDIFGHLKAYGLSNTQSKTPLCYLSAGEKCRFVLASIMIEDPPILFLDNPTSNLDVESVNAFIYGLRAWNGTIVMVCQDSYFLRSLGGAAGEGGEIDNDNNGVRCVAIVPEEGKIRRVNGGMDEYLKSFSKGTLIKKN